MGRGKLCLSPYVMDICRALKFENPDSGGTEVDLFPTATDPSEDYLAAKGISFEATQTHVIEKDGDDLRFKDSFNNKTLSELVGSIGDSFVPDYIETTITVPTHRQMNVFQRLTIDGGRLIINGRVTVYE